MEDCHSLGLCPRAARDRAVVELIGADARVSVRSCRRMIRGTEKPQTKRQSLCRHQTALTLHDVGVAALCPGRETKGVAANFVWSFQHPDSNAVRIGVVFFFGALAGKTECDAA